MAVTATDWTIDRATGNIRYIGGDHDNSPTYASVIDFHRFLQDLADDAVATPASSDELDITNTDPSRRSTDNIITLINGYQIDYKSTQFLFDGSIIQDAGDTIYDGVVNFGVASVQIQILQDGKVVSDDFWNFGGAGLNADATAGISHKFLIQTRKNGVDIDERKLIGVARTFGNTFLEFKINGTSRGNNVLALSDSSDLNNAKSLATIAGYNAINNQEGLRAIDVDNDGSTEEFWSEWNRDTQTINDLYERTKWLSKDPVTEDSSADTGSDFIVDNATILGQAQAFLVGAKATLITKATVFMKKILVPTGDILASIYTVLSSVPTAYPNTIVGQVSIALEAADITTTYENTVFEFDPPISVSAGTEYCLVIEHANGGASDYLQVRGLASSGTHSTGNRAQTSGSWAAVTADDLAFEVYTAPTTNAIAGINLRGITYSYGYDTETGAIVITTNDQLVWGTLVTYTGGSGTALVGEAVHEDTATPVWKGQVIAFDGSGATGSLLVRVESGTVGTESFTCQDSGFVGTSSGTPTAVSGGGTHHILVNDDTDDILYAQILNGGSPVDNYRLYYVSAQDKTAADFTDYVEVANAVATITERTIATPFIGASTGSALIGSYGLGVEYADLTQNDTLFDLTDTIRNPPNLVTQTVAGLVSGEDRLLVAPWDGSTTDTNGNQAIDKGQMLVSTALTIVNITSVVVKDGTETAIPSDTPASGWIRVVDDNGFERRLWYSSWDTLTFTISGGDYGDGNEDFDSVGAAVNNEVYIAYIDKLAGATSEIYQGVHTAGERDLVVVARDGGGSPIKQHISSWTFNATGQTLTITRTTDA